LREYSQVLVRGGQIPDLPGVQYKLIKGKYDFSDEENFKRVNSLSKFGIKSKNKN
jgi:small subunit ribosomal protein S12